MRALLSAFPLFIIPVGMYCLIAFTTFLDPFVLEHADEVLSAKTSPLMAVLNDSLFSITMMGSELEWVLTKGDALIFLSVIMLFLELLKSTSSGTATIVNHAFSMVLFIVCLMLFLLNGNFATSVFFVITLMTLLDVIAAVVVTIVSARRDYAYAEG